MIIEKIYGDITDPKLNRGDIIIGMNTKFNEVTGIAKRFVEEYFQGKEAPPGTVVSVKFDGKLEGLSARVLHMVVCHKLGLGGWNKSEIHLKTGLDYLYSEYYRFAQDRNKLPGIVRIGRGLIGKRDGAPYAELEKTMYNCNLLMNLFRHDEPNPPEIPIYFLNPSVWVPDRGVIRL